MEVYANIKQLVEINPQTVIEKLISKEIGFRAWILEKDGKYYIGFEQSNGGHSFVKEEEITKEKYDYIKALELILEQLKKKNT